MTVDPATQFSITGPTTPTAGVASTYTVTALDTTGAPTTAFNGTIQFFSSDQQGVSPATATVTNGVGTFTATLNTVGCETIEIVNADLTNDISGSATVEVRPAVASEFAIAAPASVTAGTAVDVTVTVLDSFGDIDTAYTGAVHFATSDSGTAVALPGDYTFVPGDFGVHVFTRSLDLATAGTQTLTVTDTGGVSGTATVTVNPAVSTGFTVIAPSDATAGSAFTFTVIATDAMGNTAQGYLGTVQFSDGTGATFTSATYTFTAADAGVHVFTSGVTITTASFDTLVVTDTTSNVTGSTNVRVSAAGLYAFLVTVVDSTNASTPVTVYVTAVDQYGNVVGSYNNFVFMSSSDSLASFDPNPDFSMTNGVGSFTATLVTPGTQTITATASGSSISGFASVTVVSQGVAAFVVTALVDGTALAAGSSISSGTTVEIQAIPVDANGNQVFGYTDTATINDSFQYVVDKTQYTMSNSFLDVFLTLSGNGDDTIIVTSYTNGRITGSSVTFTLTLVFS